MGPNFFCVSKETKLTSVFMLVQAVLLSEGYLKIHAFTNTIKSYAIPAQCLAFQRVVCRVDLQRTALSSEECIFSAIWKDRSRLVCCQGLLLYVHTWTSSQRQPPWIRDSSVHLLLHFANGRHGDQERVHNFYNSPLDLQMVAWYPLWFQVVVGGLDFSNHCNHSSHPPVFNENMIGISKTDTITQSFISHH